MSLYISSQGDTVLALINEHLLYQLNINFSRNQLDLTICCNLSDDMSFMEAILGIQHGSTFCKLTHRPPLLLAVTGDYSTLGMCNSNVYFCGKIWTEVIGKFYGKVLADNILGQLYL